MDLREIDKRVARLLEYEEDLLNSEDLPKFSVDIEAAWRLVDSLASEGFQVAVEVQPTKDWPNEAEPCAPEARCRCLSGLSGTDMVWHRSEAPTPALAICYEALYRGEK